MKAFNKLITGLKCGVFLISTNVTIVQFAHAEYTRACPAGLKIIAATVAGTNRTEFTIKNRNIVPEITMAGSPSGSSSKRLTRKSAKALSAFAATECINKWTLKAVKALNSGQVRGKVVPPGVCKKPDEHVEVKGNKRSAVLVRLNKRKFESTQASISRVRWGYNTRDDKGFYDILQKVCRSYGAVSYIQTRSEIRSGDGECKIKNDGLKWYRLTCDGDTPIKLLSS